MMLNVKQAQKQNKNPEFYIVTDSLAEICFGEGSSFGFVSSSQQIIFNMRQLLNVPDGSYIYVVQFEPEPPTHGLCAVARGMIKRGTFKQMIFEGNAVADNSVEGNEGDAQ